MKDLYIFLIYFAFLYGGIEILAYIADKRGSRKIIKEKTRYILKSSAYGYFEESSFKLNTKLKNKVLDVLRAELEELKLELEKL
ncbi:MAG: hypothetical protein E6649_16115 [Paeniclostridium sordellii]|nr:hypothetical protein [Paeniclostridium sordellii]